MKPDNSLNKPDPMAEDSLELSFEHQQVLTEILEDYSNNPSNSNKYRYQLFAQIDEYLNVYTTNKIIEELEAAGVPDYFYWNKDGRNITVGERIAELKALNHRKENK